MMSNLIMSLMVMITGGLGYNPAHAALSDEILGNWQYDGFFYESHRYPNPNPDLVLIFTFEPNGTSRLVWHRKNEPGFCERLADYEVRGNHLYQKVVWLNPANDPNCSKDSDMRLNSETNTEISIIEQELWFHLDLNGKPFKYILKAKPHIPVLPFTS